jgi:septum formation protein
MKEIILASASPRRKEILEITGLNFHICASDYEEELDLPLKPHKLARFLSLKKAEAVAHKYTDSIIIAADTFIYYKNRLLGKPHTDKEAEKMLGLLNGKVHSVITGFTIIDTGNGQIISKSVVTKVHFKKITDEEISAYVRSKEPLDKAGAYAVQGLGAVFIEKIEGDFFNVMGLPLCTLTECLKKFGVNVLNDRVRGFQVEATLSEDSIRDSRDQGKK